MKNAVFGIVCLLLTLSSSALGITVDDDGPADFSQINSAIAASTDGDTIIVRAGVYDEQVDFAGKAVTVTSEDPEDPNVVAATIITTDTGHSITFAAGEQSDSVITGFTITGQGILCDGSSPTIVGNVITGCSSRAIEGVNNAQPAITANHIIANSGGGISGCNGVISSNRITGNRANNGAGLYDCDGLIIHNIIAGNMALGDQDDGDGGGLHSCDGTIENNTLVGNVSANTVNTQTHGHGAAVYECAAILRNNIIAYNRAGQYSGAVDAQVNIPENTYNTYWANSPDHVAGPAGSGAGEQVANPWFVSNGFWDDRTTPTLADDIWIDGDYHLISTKGRWDATNQIWVYDGANSPCIDAGWPSSDWTAELWPHGRNINAGAYGGTAQASMSQSTIGLLADLDNDGAVDFRDLSIFAAGWLTPEKPVAQDLSRDSQVNMADLALLMASWTAKLSLPPEPSPMTWVTEPYSPSPTTITMVATTAVSADNTTVEYYFEDADTPSRNSGWLTFAAGNPVTWTAINLTPYTYYEFHVKARNSGNGVQTEWSLSAGVRTKQVDTTPPSPLYATWETQPYPTSNNSLKMVAGLATDESGVEYNFTCTSNPAYSSGWQDSRTYEPSGLPGGTYTFTVTYRDKSPAQNVGYPSPPVTIDFSAPTPNPMEWALNGQPRKFWKGPSQSDWAYDMTCATATDPAGGVQYFFECYEFSGVYPSGYSSGWISSTYYQVLTGISSLNLHFRVRARDMYGNETAPTPWYPSN